MDLIYRNKYLKYKNKFLSLKNNFVGGNLGTDGFGDVNKGIVRPRNQPFFNLYENVFKILNEELGEEKALKAMYKLFSASLSQSYGTEFKKGDPHEFKRVAALHDNNVGLRIGFPGGIKDDEFIYQILDDPFPGLKGLVDPKKLDASYMNFKLDYILGDDWYYDMTKHFWLGDDCIEHHFYRKK
jgi:hypothetical protein